MSWRARRTLAHEALQKSVAVRAAADLDFASPLDVYALCDTLRVSVRFVGISMEVLYVRDTPPRILISALRPYPRRVFTCGHEIGHHVFGHSSTIDELADELRAGTVFKPAEFLVQAFAGFLLMPTLGVRKSFAIRGWSAATATPTQLFMVACNFGVGYATLINHLAYGLDMLPSPRAHDLLNYGPARARRDILGAASATTLIVVDRHWSAPSLDTEVGTRLLLPADAHVEGDLLAWQADLPSGRLFEVTKPGSVPVRSVGVEGAINVRASRYQYVGLSRHRFLEESEEDDD